MSLFVADIPTENSPSTPAKIGNNERQAITIDRQSAGSRFQYLVKNPRFDMPLLSPLGVSNLWRPPVPTKWVGRTIGMDDHRHRTDWEKLHAVVQCPNIEESEQHLRYTIEMTQKDGEYEPDDLVFIDTCGKCGAELDAMVTSEPVEVLD